MRNRLKEVFIVLGLILTAFYPVFGQDFSVVCLEGYPELRDKGTWIELNEGDDLDSEDLGQGIVYYEAGDYEKALGFFKEGMGSQ